MSKALFATARVSGWRGICCQLTGSDRFPSGDDTHDHHFGQTKPKREELAKMIAFTDNSTRQHASIPID
jgi:hypothetical protein